MTTKSESAPDWICPSCGFERQSSEPEATGSQKSRPFAASCDQGIVGYWTPVTEKMPNDKVTVLVWVESMHHATLASHDSEVLSRRGDSGWIIVRGTRSNQVLLNVTHWCADINPPNTDLLEIDEMRILTED